MDHPSRMALVVAVVAAKVGATLVTSSRDLGASISNSKVVALTNQEASTNKARTSPHPHHRAATLVVRTKAILEICRRML
jgi:hypothetical protein